MPDFKYKAIDAAGKVSTGVLSAGDKKTAAAMLASLQLNPITLKPVSESDAAMNSEVASSSENGVRKGGGENVALALVKKLHQLCGSGGMPVSDALKALSQRSLDKRIKKISRELYKDLSEGKMLANALEKYPDTFDPCMTHLVEAGESTANLSFVFENIINYINARKTLRQTIISALAYPIFLCLLASAVVMLFLFFMLPKIKSMMANMGAGENLPIKMMNAIGEILTTGVPVFAVLAVIAIIALKFYRKTEDGLKNTDAAFLKIPVIGKIIFDSDICRFSNLASTLFASGVNTTETFRLSEKSLKNAQMRSRFQAFRTAVNDGAPISAALQRFNLLESEDIDVISVGERTGNLVNGFAEINKSHAESLNKRIKIGTAALGGVALGTAFLLVFIFAMGIVLSILGLSQSIIAR